MFRRSCFQRRSSNPDLGSMQEVHPTRSTKHRLQRRRAFGSEVRRIVEEVTDDKELPKAERKDRQVRFAGRLSAEAKLGKIADKTANSWDMVRGPPADWDWRRRQEYLLWAEEVVEGCRGVNPELESLFDEVLDEAREESNSLNFAQALSSDHHGPLCRWQSMSRFVPCGRPRGVGHGNLLPGVCTALHPQSVPRDTICVGGQPSPRARPASRVGVLGDRGMTREHLEPAIREAWGGALRQVLVFQYPGRRRWCITARIRR